MIRKTFATIGVAAIAITALAGLNFYTTGNAAESGFRGVASGLFISHDVNNDSLVTPDEIGRYAQIAFISMDANDDGAIDRAEFLAWDPGFVHVAARAGKLGEVEAVKMQAFTAADTDGNHAVDSTEMSAITLSGFAVADADESGDVTLSEFTSGFPIVTYIAMALNS